MANEICLLASWCFEEIGHDGTIFTKKGHDKEPFEFRIDEGGNGYFPILFS